MHSPPARTITPVASCASPGARTTHRAARDIAYFAPGYWTQTDMLFPLDFTGSRLWHRDVGSWQILLQKSLATLLNNDSVALMQFAVEAIDDGAAQSRPR